MTAVVVGGGIAGVACATALARGGVPVELRERSARLGGRMRSTTLQGTGTPHDGRLVDVGASYLTARDPAFRAVIDDLVDRRVLRPWTDAFHVADARGLVGVSAGPMRYAAADGLDAVVRTLADDVDGLRVRLGSPVSEVRHAAGLHVDGESVVAAALCLPDPVARTICPEPAADPVAWEPVIAVTMVFDRRSWTEIDGVFVNDDPAITWIADDGRRRGDEASVLVAFTHPVLSARHRSEPGRVVPAVVAATVRVLGITTTPDWVDALAWEHAKPLAAAPQPYLLAPQAALGLAGDAWADGPRVEAAWMSGTALGEALVERVTADSR